MLDLIDQAVRRTQQGEPVALCVIVSARGSTPQSRGAAMLVTSAGSCVGTLGGGCVEAEVRVRAQRLILEKKNRLLTFRLDHDFGWDDGLVCGGTMDIAVTVLDSPNSLSQLRNDLLADKPATLKMIVEDEHSSLRQFEIPIAPAPKLVIAGAGHVGQALAAVAARIGFRTMVIDDRADLLSTDRFPTAARIPGAIEAELSRLSLDDNAYLVIVTRGHKHDAQALRAAINLPWKYLGMIGSRPKVRRILADLHAQGIPTEKLAAVHAPIGFEIGAVTADEIAVSIAAELIATRRGRGDKPATSMKIPGEDLKNYLPE